MVEDAHGLDLLVKAGVLDEGGAGLPPSSLISPLTTRKYRLTVTNTRSLTEGRLVGLSAVH